jgi:hypothetical protein
MTDRENYKYFKIYNSHYMELDEGFSWLIKISNSPYVTKSIKIYRLDIDKGKYGFRIEFEKVCEAKDTKRFRIFFNEMLDKGVFVNGGKRKTIKNIEYDVYIANRKKLDSEIDNYKIYKKILAHFERDHFTTKK